jgi:putative transcriptional regulator
MLNDNLKMLRKEKGFSQEELASKLHVVRQTVSKWEKGLSVPDADLLVQIAEVFEVPVSRLLGAEPAPAEKAESAARNEIAEQLMKINEQLVIKNNRARKIIKWLIIIFVVIPAVLTLLTVFALVTFKTTGTGPNNQPVIETGYVDVIL